MARPVGQIHRKSATAEQRERFRRVCELLEYPIEDVPAPEGVHQGACKTVAFHVDKVELDVPLELCDALGITKTMLSRIAWRIGTCMLEARTLEADRG